MKVSVTSLAIGVALAAAPALASAQAPALPTAEAQRFAVINIQRVASESTEGKASTARVQALNQKKITELNELNKRLQADQQKLQSQGSMLNEAARAELERSIDKEQKDLQRSQQDAQEEVQQLQQDLQNGFQAKLLPIIQQVVNAFTQAVNDAVQAQQSGSVAQSDALVQQMTGPLLALTAVMWGVRLVYDVGFLKAFAATPGKMVLGLEVRLRERPGPLSWGTVLARWFTANLGSLLSLLPVVALFAWAYSLLDVLWPLWDPKRQALHDKVARTNVVRTR